MDFTTKLYTEQAIKVTPGEIFGGRMFFRIVTCSDKDVLLDFCDRLKTFHAKYVK